MLEDNLREFIFWSSLRQFGLTVFFLSLGWIALLLGLVFVLRGLISHKIAIRRQAVYVALLFLGFVATTLLLSGYYKKLYALVRFRFTPRFYRVIDCELKSVDGFGQRVFCNEGVPYQTDLLSDKGRSYLGQRVGQMVKLVVLPTSSRDVVYVLSRDDGATDVEFRVVPVSKEILVRLGLQPNFIDSLRRATFSSLWQFFVVVVIMILIYLVLAKIWKRKIWKIQKVHLIFVAAVLLIFSPLIWFTFEREIYLLYTFIRLRNTKAISELGYAECVIVSYEVNPPLDSWRWHERYIRKIYCDRDGRFKVNVVPLRIYINRSRVKSCLIGSKAQFLLLPDSKIAIFARISCSNGGGVHTYPLGLQGALR